MAFGNSFPLIDEISNFTPPIFPRTETVNSPGDAIPLHLVSTPSHVVDKAHRPERLNLPLGPPVEWTKCFIAFKKKIELHERFINLTRQEHPDILNRRTHGHIVKIN